MKKGKMRHRLRIERTVAAGGFDGAGSGSWAPVCECWAEVQDVLPSNTDRDEKLASGISTTSRTSRVRMSYRSGINSDMRILIGRNVWDEQGEAAWRTDRTMQIITEPAEMGRRDGLEFMVEDYRPAGNPA